MLICAIFSEAQSHRQKNSPSALPRSGLSIERHRRPGLTNIENYHTSETIAPIFLQSSPLTVASTSPDQHFQWWDNSNSPELVQSGWYGFNRFTPRAARNLGTNANRKARTSYLLGESSQIQPITSFKGPQQQQKQYDEDLAIHEVLRELQRHIHPLPQREQYVEPRLIMIEEAFGLPPGILVPVMHPSQHNTIPRHANYHRPQTDHRRLASAPTPVTIKVVPLKITSMDIANALKSMSFVPLSLDFMKTDDNAHAENAEITYDDKRSSDDESDLPPPSSHVATPMEKPLGITYAETQRAQHFMRNYQPRK